MGIVLADQGKLELLQKMLKLALTVNENYILKMFQNDYTPTQSTTSSSFVEADFTNYVAKTLTRSNWNTAVFVNDTAEASYGVQPFSWTCGTLGNTLYGYWVEASVSGKVLWAERFNSGQEFGQSDIVRVTPRFALGIRHTNILTEDSVNIITEDEVEIVSE